MTPARRAIRLVPHTHWDREWYLTFEEFRDRLVEVVDSLLELLRRDDRLSHFHLDGQTAMVDDYLSVRPEREKELAAYIASGRLSCGPWVTLVDEFLVSGETTFTWSAPDGSTVVALYLPFGYGQAGKLPPEPEAFLERLGRELERSDPF